MTPRSRIPCKLCALQCSWGTKKCPCENCLIKPMCEIACREAVDYWTEVSNAMQRSYYYDKKYKKEKEKNHSYIDMTKTLL